MAQGHASAYDGGPFPLRFLPVHRLFHRLPQRFFFYASASAPPVASAALALCVASVVAGCARMPAPAEPPVAEPVQAAIASVYVPDGAISVTPVLSVYRTQQVETGTRERCGHQIAPPPAKSLWSRMFLSTPDGTGDVPAPVFVPETACDTVASRSYRPARYRVTYRFDDEIYSVDLDEDPGAALRIDSLGRVVGPAQLN